MHNKSVKTLINTAVVAFCLTLTVSASSDTLIVGGTQAPGTLGNPYGGSGQPASMVWSAIYDGLTEFDAKGRIQPALATSWETSDPFTWRFHLREGVTFHNGRPFNAAAVAGTFDYGWPVTPYRYIRRHGNGDHVWGGHL